MIKIEVCHAIKKYILIMSNKNTIYIFIELKKKKSDVIFLSYIIEFHRLRFMTKFNVTN